MSVVVRMLDNSDKSIVLAAVPELFDEPPDARLTNEFLADPRHHLAGAIDDQRLVGMASAVHYLHPDKPAELWINELGVAPGYRRQGLARALLRELSGAARALGCRQAWVLTEASNAAALALYAAQGGQRVTPETVMFEFDLDAQRQPGPSTLPRAPGEER